MIAFVRALGRLASWPLRRIAGARLRTKLALALSVAALLPMLVVASLASGVVLGSLDRDLRQDVERQLEVGQNLTLRAVERLGEDAVRLASDDALARAVPGGEAPVHDVIARAAPHLPSALVQVFSLDGHTVVTEVIGGDTATELPVGGRAEYDVEFSPGATGAFEADLDVFFDGDPEAQYTLHARGTAVTVPGRGDPYSCGASRGGAAWPLLLGLALALRRRRRSVRPIRFAT